MKNLLLGTSALFGAVAFVGAAHAEAPKVSVGGFVDFQVGIRDEDNTYDANEAGHKFNNDTEIHFRVDGKSDSGLGYGAVVELEADQSNDPTDNDQNADRTYVYLEGGWGRFEMGGNAGSTKTMKVDASNFARATGGISGDFHRYVDAPSATFAIMPELVIDHGAFGTTGAGNTVLQDQREDANKITYYSPRFNGFQLGVSYTADADDTGNLVSSTFSADNAGTAESVWGLGLTYAGQWEDIGINLSATGEWGDAKQAAQDDVSAYAFGANLLWSGISFGGSWGTWDDSLGLNDASFWDLGAAYDFGPFGASITYFNSEAEPTAGQENEFSNVVIGADYMLAPGLVPYIEASFFEFDEDAAIGNGDNDGSVVMVGTELTF